jgi:transposase InsO family protein
MPPSALQNADRKRTEYAKELHAQTRRPTSFRPVVVLGPNRTWAADVMHMPEDAATLNSNNQKSKVLVVIDCFTRYAWALVVDNLQQQTIWPRFQELLNEPPVRAKSKLRHLWVDRGSEFVNKNVNGARSFFEQQCLRRGIQVYHTYSENKSALAERLIRTLREKLAVALTAHNTTRWVSGPSGGPPAADNLLEKVVHDYNYEDVHRAIGMTPIAAWTMCYTAGGDEKLAGVQTLWYKQYALRTAQQDRDRRPPRNPLEEGDKVQFTDRPTDARRRVDNVDEEGYPLRYDLHVKPEDDEPYDEYGVPRPELQRYRRTKYRVGDWVRIATFVKQFAKKTDVMRWSAEKFRVVKVRTNTQPEAYVLQGEDEPDPLVGSFYAADLAITKSPTDPGHFDDVEEARNVRRFPAQGGVRQFEVKLFGQTRWRWLPELGARGVGDLTSKLPTAARRAQSIAIANAIANGA